MKKLIAVVVLIAFFRHFFRCPHRELFFWHKPTGHQDQTGLVVSAVCTGASTLSQAKIYRPECSAQISTRIGFYNHFVPECDGCVSRSVLEYMYDARTTMSYFGKFATILRAKTRF